MTNDLDLYEKIKSGDELAFEAAFRTFYTSLCLFSNKLVKDAEVAEEIVQDLFYNFWEKRETLDLQVSLKSYLFRAVYNNSLKYLRHRKIMHEHENHVLTTGENMQHPENTAEMGEMIHIINQTLADAPERSRQIFEMNRNDGLKYNEIAEKLNISVKTVEAHITSLLKTFRQNLRDYMVIFILIYFPFYLG